MNKRKISLRGKVLPPNLMVAKLWAKQKKVFWFDIVLSFVPFLYFWPFKTSLVLPFHSSRSPLLKFSHSSLIQFSFAVLFRSSLSKFLVCPFAVAFSKFLSFLSFSIFSRFLVSLFVSFSFGFVTKFVSFIGSATEAFAGSKVVPPILWNSKFSNVRERFPVEHFSLNVRINLSDSGRQIFILQRRQSAQWRISKH